jgi:hypothetical protein
MSKVSSKARYEAFSEWLKWAQNKYPSMKRKRESTSRLPAFK